MAQAQSVVQEEAAEHATLGVTTEAGWDSVNRVRSRSARSALLPQQDDSCRVDRVVFGWHPYWMGTAYDDYDFALLSDVCYFSYEVDPSTGSYTSIHNWRTTGLVDAAKNAGRRVHLCVTLFGNHAQLLGNVESRDRLIDSLAALLRERNADGVNIDFEAMPSSQRSSFTDFIAALGARFHRGNNTYSVSIALPAVDWSSAFDVAAMLPYVDLFIIMGYDYHWSGSTNAGPVSPKNSGTIWSPYDVTRSINTWLLRGIPPRQLCLGVPYYGREWSTADSTVGSSTTGTTSAVLYASASDDATTFGRRWETQSSTPYYAYASDTAWRQCWYDDAESLGAKYDLVVMKGLAGIGIWALGYDAGRPELWTALRDHLSSCAAAACEGSFTDMGGAAGNYYPNDDYTWTIAPANAGGVNLAFNSFSIADDTLWIFDGDSADDPLIGAYTAQRTPGVVAGSHGALTVRFKSNDTLASWGWTATWTCSVSSGADPVVLDVPALDLTIHPNPVVDMATIEFSADRPGLWRIDLVDLTGRSVGQFPSRDCQPGRYRFLLDRARMTIAAGLYTVVVRGPGCVAAQPIMLR